MTGTAAGKLLSDVDLCKPTPNPMATIINAPSTLAIVIN